VQRLTYGPFGRTQKNTGSVDFARHRFTGQKEDPETELYFYQARYDTPAPDRFLTRIRWSPTPAIPGGWSGSP